MTLLQAIIIAIVEGITEFLPISSTGHMIIAQALLGVQPSQFVKAFTVIIQFGAITSVLFLYWKRFFQSVDFYYKLIVAFIPAAIMGLLFGDIIDDMLEQVDIVAISLMLGGWILIYSDKWFAHNKEKEEQPTTYKKAFFVGLFQCIALIPGVSRSAATMIGGMVNGWNRKQAAEFSFFLAVPTMFAASAKKTFDAVHNGYASITDNWQIILLGCLVSAIIAGLSIKYLMMVLQNKGFAYFGWYRVILGAIILSLLMARVPLEIMG
jgi:undecaprenyl-diphosphatase